MYIHKLIRTVASATLLGSVLGACSLSDLVDTNPPTGNSGITDPESINSEEAAINMYRGVITKFRGAVSGTGQGASYIVTSGMLGDELNAAKFNTLNTGSFTTLSLIDGRHIPESGMYGSLGAYEGTWRNLHGVRTQAMNSLGALRKYAPDAPRVYQGNLFSLWGMAEVMLANLFCSGIPLTTIEFEGDFNYAPGSPTPEVYRHALAMFDSALVYASDSADIRNFVKLGQAWAHLNLNEYAQAATIAAEIPTSFVYLNLHSMIETVVGVPNFTYGVSLRPTIMGSVSDREGGNGLPYRTSGDPRTLVEMVRDRMPSAGDDTLYMPRRWRVPDPGTSIVVASGVEARLIEAEVALDEGQANWLTILNGLRNSGVQSVNGVDTVWAPGSGAILFTSVGGTLPGLPPLEDPGSPDARLDLLMQERAYWLFLTGRRLPDMRRLIRQYGRDAESVFPRGAYPSGPLGSYGIDVNLPAPLSERQANGMYQGCIDRGA